MARRVASRASSPCLVRCRWTADGVAYEAGWSYFPSLGETIITVGMACIGMAIFLFISRKFPVVVVESRGHSNVAGAAKAAAGR